MTEEDVQQLKSDIKHKEIEGCYIGLKNHEIVEQIQLHARSTFESLLSINLMKKKSTRVLKSKKITRDYIREKYGIQRCQEFEQLEISQRDYLSLPRVQKVINLTTKDLEEMDDDAVLAAVDDEDEDKSLKRKETMKIITESLIDSDQELSIQKNSSDEEDPLKIPESNIKTKNDHDT